MTYDHLIRQTSLTFSRSVRFNDGERLSNIEKGTVEGIALTDSFFYDTFYIILPWWIHSLLFLFTFIVCANIFVHLGFDIRR